jgi:hypothetical protein
MKSSIEKSVTSRGAEEAADFLGAAMAESGGDGNATRPI